MMPTERLGGNARTPSAKRRRQADEGHPEETMHGTLTPRYLSRRPDARKPQHRSGRPKKKVHRRKPWSLGERLRNLTPDFMDVRRRNCSIARHFRH
ncbi:hypothetical protein, partial [Burkholderia pseudomallei]